MEENFYFSYFCFVHSYFVFIPLTVVKYFPPICYFLLNFLVHFSTLSFNILLCCLRVWVESSCQRSCFDSFKCFTPHLTYFSSLCLFIIPFFHIPFPVVLVLCQVPKVGEPLHMGSTQHSLQVCIPTYHSPAVTLAFRVGNPCR